MKVLERVAAARERTRAETWERVAPLLTPHRRAELDSLLTVDPVLGRTRMAWLEAGPVSATPAAVKDELEKLAFLRGMDAHTIDLSVLPAERRRFLAGVGRRLTPQHLARRDDGRRCPVLLTLVTQSAVDVLDEVLLLFDQALTGREAAAKSKMTEALAERARTGEDRQALLDDILRIVLDPDVSDDQVGGRLRADVGHGRMRAAWESRRARLPRDHGHLAMMDASMSYLRQFVPAVLAAVRFDGAPGMDDLLNAVTILAGLYAAGARKVPDGAPEGFVPARWAGYLETARKAGDVTAFRHYWELCVLMALRDGLRSGDVHVPGSRRYADPASFLLTPQQWEPQRLEFCHLVGKPALAADALALAAEQGREPARAQAVPGLRERAGRARPRDARPAQGEHHLDRPPAQRQPLHSLQVRPRAQARQPARGAARKHRRAGRHPRMTTQPAPAQIEQLLRAWGESDGMVLRFTRLAGRGSARRGAWRWRHSRRAVRARSMATASRTPCRAGRQAPLRRVSG